ncbi:hypothetical protein ONE63_006687 [Megalurothrips usitatus]|uniref:Uncharacterized protein n=1 Tax=Megalurothrips usitatus TaxID=439358 RepID=A0AAV7Y1I9_9NEOP|nr:hypothetical protein ONE63_006687 [Megalurothrips usitatus]
MTRENATERIFGRYLRLDPTRISLYTSVPNVAALYPDVAFPVPRGTASVAALVHWPAETNPYNYVFDKISIRPPEQELDVHYDSPSVKVNGIRLFPLSEQLVPVWLDVAVKESRPIGAFPVTFVDVKVRDWVAIPAKGKISLRTSLMPGTAEAIVLADDRLVTQVQAFANDEPPHQLHALDPASWHATTRSKEQVYSDLCSRGMDYSSKYQNIQSIRRGGRGALTHSRWNLKREALLSLLSTLL